MSNMMRVGSIRAVGLLFCLVGLAVLLTSCGGDGGGGGGTPPVAAPLPGVFVDSPVEGLGYTTSSGLSGTTDANGSFGYNPGDTVAFTIFGRAIGGAVPATPVVTALSVFNATSLTDPRVLNLSQLLLTLAGGVPANQAPIVLPPTPPANFPAALDFSDPGFDTSILGLPLVSEADATTHLQAQFSTVSVVLAGSGAGSGSVASNPAGINCGTTCSFVFTNGTAITLTATGTGFAGWSGGCSGTGTCVVTLNANTAVTATFSQGTTSNRYLFMRDFALTVMAIDPANPGATPAVVSNAALAPIAMLTSGWDAVKATYTNVTSTYVMYASAGKLWRVSVPKSSGVPGSVSNPPVQVSSEAAATNVCVTEQAAHTTSGNTRLVYELAGADNNCFTQNDNVTKLVSALDSAVTPPTALPAGSIFVGPGHGPGVVVDLSTGAATGIFLLDVANSNTLKFMNLNTSVITTIQANIGHVFALSQDTSDRVFLLGGPTHNQLYLYTVSTNSLVTLVSGASPLVTGQPLGDGTNLYLAEQANGKLYKVPQNATGPSDVVTLLASLGFPIGDPFRLGGVIVTTNNVFLQTYVPCSGGCIPPPPNLDQDASGLYRVPKAGGAATPIVTHAVGAGIFDVRSVNNLVYYNHKRSPAVPAASIISEDGTSVYSTPVTCPGGCGHWSADINLPTYSVRTGDRPLSKRVLLVFASDTQNGATLFVFDAPTGTQGANLGIVPATTPVLTALFGQGFLDSALLMTGLQNGSATNLLFFADTLLPGSLTQVPTIPAAFWQEVGFFGF